MKLHQEEYCHHCNHHVTFEFDDEEYRQVINCPVCGHEHYRELDQGVLLNIRLYGREQQTLRMAKMKNLMPCGFVSANESVSASMFDVEIEERRVVANQNGLAVVEAKEGEESDTKIVSKRRWGSAN